MPSGKIQRQKISSFKICLEAIGIRHLCWGDDSPAWDKKTTGEIIPSIQMKPGIEPSNVALNTSLLCSHGTKAAARTDRGFACSSERASCAKKSKWFASCLALSTAAPSQSAHGVLWRLASKVSCWVWGAPVVLHRMGIMIPLCLRLHRLHCGEWAWQSFRLSSKAGGADSAHCWTGLQGLRFYQKEANTFQELVWDELNSHQNEGLSVSSLTSPKAEQEFLVTKRSAVEYCTQTLLKQEMKRRKE